jgi:hypothetical protein
MQLCRIFSICDIAAPNNSALGRIAPLEKPLARSGRQVYVMAESIRQYVYEKFKTDFDRNSRTCP